MITSKTYQNKVNRINKINKELNAIKLEKERLTKRESILQQEIADIVISFTEVMFANPAETFSISPDMTIGDAMENVLKNMKAITQKNAIKILNGAKIPISKKNPYVTIANLIKKDAKKRFTRTKEGNLTLRKENE